MNWRDLLTALALVAALEGLALALLPGRLDALVKALAQIPIEVRRRIGLAMLAFAVGVLYLLR